MKEPKKTEQPEVVKKVKEDGEAEPRNGGKSKDKAKSCQQRSKGGIKDEKTEGSGKREGQ